MNEEPITRHEYLTDDRDGRQRQKNVVGWAENGDYYVSVCAEDELPWKAVRICTSGGAASRNPQLVRAVRGMFEALGGFEHHTGCTCKDQSE